MVFTKQGTIMTRRVRAPDAQAELGGEKRERPPSQGQKPGKGGLAIGFLLIGARLTVGRPAYPGGDVGPNPTPRTKPVGSNRWRGPVPDHQPRTGPEANDRSAKYKAVGAAFPAVGFRPQHGLDPS